MSVFVAIEEDGCWEPVAISRGLPLRCESGRDNDRPANAKIFGLAARHQISHFTSQAAPSSTQASTLLILQSQLAMFLPRNDAGFCKATSSSPPSFTIISSRYWISSPEVSLSDYLSAVLAISQHRAGLASSLNELLIHSLIRSNITTSAGAFYPTNHWVSIAPL